VLADKAYSSRANRALLRCRGIRATIPEKDDQAAHQLPRGVRRRGRIAWLAWVALHIVTLVGHRNRLPRWPTFSVRYLAWPGRLNVIVGDPP
jgi:NADH:ubiquinone reductase (H+-translocating)